MRSLFVHRPGDLDAEIPGGLQLCTREFLSTVQAASDFCEAFHVELDLSLKNRLRRRFSAGSYLSFEPRQYEAALAQRITEQGITHVFLNTTDALRFAPVIKRVHPEAIVVLMSHGNQSGDNLYEIAGPHRRFSAVSRFLQTWQLGLDLRTESSIRHSSVDVVCVMSEEEAVFERWLGARQTFVIPRIVEPSLLAWQPVSGRAGYAGTLNHTPNRVALEEVFRTIAARPHEGGEIRLVGRPEGIGRDFAARYPFVRYLGGMSDGDLRQEATSWSAFLNPIFWLSRGASMKLAQALGWGLPTVTSISGRRGYRLPDEVMMTTPDAAGPFAAGLLELLGDPDRCSALHAAIVERMSEFPTARSLGGELRAALVGGGCS